MRIRFFIAMMLILLFAAFAFAQEKLTIPLSSPSQPATVKVNGAMRSIIVTTWANPQIGISDSLAPKKSDEVPPGMHRLDVHSGLQATEDHNTVTLNASHWLREGDLTIQVPVNTNLQIQSQLGRTVEVTGVSGDIEVEGLRGSIQLMNVSGSVVAHSMNGDITASFDRIAAGKPMSFTSMNGKIDVTLPADTKARLRIKSERGAVYTDFDVKTEARQATETSPMVRRRIDSSDTTAALNQMFSVMGNDFYGSINGGGPEYAFQTMNGRVLIRKK